MSENTSNPSQGESAQPGDELKNLKAEFNRKLDNSQSRMEQSLAEIKKLISVPASASPSKPASTKVSVFEDEDRYTESVVSEAEKRIETKLSQRDAYNSKLQSTYQAILSDYPEASDTGSDLSKRAVEIYASYSEDEKSPVAMRAAVASAASELGLKPKSKRQSSSNDGFSLGGSSAQPGKKASDLDPTTETWASIMGLDTNDPKVRERLKSRAPKTYKR
jgi:hypothetical protein